MGKGGDMFAFSFFHSVVVRQPLNFTGLADSKAGFFYQQGL